MFHPVFSHKTNLSLSWSLLYKKMNSLPSSPSSHFWKRSLLSSLLHHFNANLPPRLEKWVSGEKQRMRACVVVHPCVCVHAKERAGEEDTKWKYLDVRGATSTTMSTRRDDQTFLQRPTTNFLFSSVWYNMSLFISFPPTLLHRSAKNCSSLTSSHCSPKSKTTPAQVEMHARLSHTRTLAHTRTHPGLWA